MRKEGRKEGRKGGREGGRKEAPLKLACFAVPVSCDETLLH
jgi:hypothetical protein